MRYDFSDPYIEGMVARDHEPKEYFRSNVAGFSNSLGINCTWCKQPWPCPPIAELRAWKEKQKEMWKAEFKKRVEEEKAKSPHVVPPGYQAKVTADYDG